MSRLDLVKSLSNHFVQMVVVKIQENAVDMRACAIDDRDMSRVHASSSLQMHNLLFALSHRLQVVSKLLVPIYSYLAKEVDPTTQLTR